MRLLLRRIVHTYKYDTPYSLSVTMYSRFTGLGFWNGCLCSFVLT